MHKPILKLRRVVEIRKTSKEEGTRNMEEGTRNEVETMKNKKVEARQKGGEGGKRWREKSSSKKGQKIQGVF
jgi:hypothetical protein